MSHVQQLGDEEGAQCPGTIAYLYGYRDEWRVHIRVEQILSAAAGVAYPRCTRGQGENIPGEGYWGVTAAVLRDRGVVGAGHGG